MNTSPVWLDYRLRELEFQNGGRIGFARARMLYNEAENVVAVERLAAPLSKIEKVLAEMRDASGNLPELKTIFYNMEIETDGPAKVLRFFHPIKAGAGVRLLPPVPGQSVLFIAAGGAPLFSKDWTLRDVSEGAIPSEKRVWQFHGWRHEH